MIHDMSNLDVAYRGHIHDNSKHNQVRAEFLTNSIDTFRYITTAPLTRQSGLL